MSLTAAAGGGLLPARICPLSPAAISENIRGDLQNTAVTHTAAFRHLVRPPAARRQPSAARRPSPVACRGATFQSTRHSIMLCRRQTKSCCRSAGTVHVTMLGQLVKKSDVPKYGTRAIRQINRSSDLNATAPLTGGGFLLNQCYSIVSTTHLHRGLN